VYVDFREHRLPNGLTLRLLLVLVVSMIVSSLSLHDWTRWQPMIAAVFCVSTVFFILYLLSKNGLGFGDVKFAIPCAMTIGWYSPGQWLDYLWITFGCAALTSIILWILGKANRSSAIAFGPYMYLGVIIITCKTLVSG